MVDGCNNKLILRSSHESLESLECKLHTHGDHNQAHETGDRFAEKATLFLPPRNASNNITQKVTTIVTALATKAVTGKSVLECATASVMARVIVPGLAANKTSCVSDV